MKLFITPDFLRDLKNADDHRFVRRVIHQVLDDKNEFRRGQDDHRFHGIDDAWIRYVSSGKTAYRLIYIQKGENVYLYRAGSHSIEDDLARPRSKNLALPVEDVAASVSRSGRPRDPTWFDAGELLRTQQEVMLKKVVLSMLSVGHHEIFLISPFVSEQTLSRWSPLGRFLDKMIEEETSVWLVTRPPELERLGFFKELEERDFGVCFYKGLHAKLYIFNVDAETLNIYTKDVEPTAIIGSANLTEMGLALSNELANEELCYRLPSTKYGEARDYACWLISHSEDFTAYRNRATRRF